jgi:hypothetical protein
MNDSKEEKKTIDHFFGLLDFIDSLPTELQERFIEEQEEIDDLKFRSLSKQSTKIFDAKEYASFNNDLYIKTTRKTYYKNLFFPKSSNKSDQHMKLNQLIENNEGFYNYDEDALHKFFKDLDEKLFMTWVNKNWRCVNTLENSITFYKYVPYDTIDKDKRKDKICCVRIYIDQFETDESEEGGKFHKIDSQCFTIGDSIYGVPLNLIARMNINTINFDRLYNVIHKHADIDPIICIIADIGIATNDYTQQKFVYISYIQRSCKTRRDMDIFDENNNNNNINITKYDTPVNIHMQNVSTFLAIVYSHISNTNDMYNESRQSLYNTISKIKKSYIKRPDLYNILPLNYNEMFIGMTAIGSDHVDTNSLLKIGADDFLDVNLHNYYFTGRKSKIDNRVIVSGDPYMIPNHILKSIFGDESSRDKKENIYFNVFTFKSSFMLNDLMQLNNQFVCISSLSQYELWNSMDEYETRSAKNNACFKYYEERMKLQYNSLKKWHTKYKQADSQLKTYYTIPYSVVPFKNTSNDFIGFFVLIDMKFIIDDSGNLTFVNVYPDTIDDHIIMFDNNNIEGNDYNIMFDNNIEANAYKTKIGDYIIEINRKLSAENILAMSKYITQHINVQAKHMNEETDMITIKLTNQTRIMEIEKKRLYDIIQLVTLHDASSHKKQPEIKKQLKLLNKKKDKKDKKDKKHQEEQQPFKKFKQGNSKFEESFSELNI